MLGNDSVNPFVRFGFVVQYIQPELVCNDIPFSGELSYFYIADSRSFKVEISDITTVYFFKTLSIA